jgi:Holliday junction resolvase RusA-like endonuclease
LIIYFFKSLRVRDLDNRNRKYLIDAIKKTRIINDDNWQTVTLIEKGIFSNHDDHIKVYVLDERYLPEFLALNEFITGKNDNR